MTIRIPVVEQITKANDLLAQANRARLDALGLRGLNVMASPGAGKTSLIERTVPALEGGVRVGVVEGDAASTLDAERAAAAGAISVQINTGGSAIKDAAMPNRVRIPVENVSMR